MTRDFSTKFFFQIMARMIYLCIVIEIFFNQFDFASFSFHFGVHIFMILDIVEQVCQFVFHK
jgi:hypothetical protein